MSIDIALVLSIISVVASVITIYLAHLRGPNVRIAVPGDYFPLRGLAFDPNTRRAMADVSVLVANEGIRPGILFSLHLDPVDEEIRSFKPQEGSLENLPTILLAGDGLKTGFSAGIAPTDGSWEEFLGSKKTVRVKATYRCTASFGRVVNRNTLIQIDLRPVLASYREWSTGS